MHETCNNAFSEVFDVVNVHNFHASTKIALFKWRVTGEIDVLQNEWTVAPYKLIEFFLVSLKTLIIVFKYNSCTTAV